MVKRLLNYFVSLYVGLSRILVCVCVCLVMAKQTNCVLFFSFCFCCQKIWEVSKLFCFKLSCTFIQIFLFRQRKPSPYTESIPDSLSCQVPKSVFKKVHRISLLIVKVPNGIQRDGNKSSSVATIFLLMNMENIPYYVELHQLKCPKSKLSIFFFSFYFS